MTLGAESRIASTEPRLSPADDRSGRGADQPRHFPHPVSRFEQADGFSPSCLECVLTAFGSHDPSYRHVVPGPLAQIEKKSLAFPDQLTAACIAGWIWL